MWQPIIEYHFPDPVEDEEYGYGLHAIFAVFCGNLAPEFCAGYGYKDHNRETSIRFWPVPIKIGNKKNVKWFMYLPPHNEFDAQIEHKGLKFKRQKDSW